jgi:hypothetical protein
MKPVLFALLTACAAALTASAQNVDSRATAIAASFNKNKNVVKEKHGIRREKYKQIRSAPAVKSNPADYSGKYESEGLGFSLDLAVDARGNITGSGAEPMDADGNILHKFTLKNGRVKGAHFTATKAYADGKTEKLEGAFITETVFDSPTDKGTSRFGLGIINSGVVVAGGVNLDSIFLERR